MLPREAAVCNAVGPRARERRLALARVREILTFAQTMYQLAAQEEQGLQLRKAARTRESHLSRKGGLRRPQLSA
jgi:hypothetical protein